MPVIETSLDHTLMALADPTRRAILQRLTDGEARVTEIAEPLPMSLNGVSKHIRMLERADLVRRRRAGREHFLSLNPRPLDEAADWIETQRALWTRRLDVLERLLRAEDAAAARAREPNRAIRKRAQHRSKPIKKRSKA
jgi:DNA-binding transcriptional ArsR family regulator